MKNWALILHLFLLSCVMSAGCSNQTPVEPDSSRLREQAARSLAIQQTILSLKADIESNGGWFTWQNSLKPFRKRIASLALENFSTHLRGIEVNNGYVFFDYDIDYILNSQIDIDNAGRYLFTARTSRPDALYALIHLDREIKKRGSDLIVVPIPKRIEIYPHKLDPEVDPNLDVDPLRTALLLDLLEADIEVLDLTPAFKQFRDYDESADGEGLYHTNDGHYSSSGMYLAAKIMAKRLRRYHFTRQTDTSHEETQITTDSTKKLNPDLTPSHIRTWHITQFKKDGAPLTPSNRSPIVIFGDSFVGHPAWITGANIVAHLSNQLRIPISSTWSAGGGPQIAVRLARQGEKFIDSHRVFIALISSGYLTTKYDGQWKSAPLP